MVYFLEIVFGGTFAMVRPGNCCSYYCSIQ